MSPPPAAIPRPAVAVSVLLLAIASIAPLQALEEKQADKDSVQACERKLCGMVLKKPAKGEDLSCTLNKTWGRDSIKGGAQSSAVSWKFGDARCTLPLKVKRESIVAALTKPEYAFEPGEHTVECHVEQGNGMEVVHITLAPKIAFKQGQAKTVWLNVRKVSGPASIKAMVWTVAGLEDNMGLFHRPMIKEINKFVHQKCAEKYSGK